MAKKFKATELFLSLGLIASLATACGGPVEEGGESIEDGGEMIEEPAGEPIEEAEEAEEGGEGGEGGEG